QLSLRIELDDVASAVAGDMDQLPQCGNAVVRTYWNQRRCLLHATEIHASATRAQSASAVGQRLSSIGQLTAGDRRAVREFRHRDGGAGVGLVGAIAAEDPHLLETRLAGVAVRSVGELVVAQADI